MASFKDFRDLLVISYDSKLVSDEEFLLLYEEFQSKNPDFEYERYPVFDLDNISAADCYAEFRFEKNDIPLLAEALQLPFQIRCEQRSMCDGVEGLCMLLKRIAYPCRYSDLIPRFGRPVSALSLITNQVIDKIFHNHSHRIVQWNNNILNPPALQNYALAISQKGAALNNCFGFIDGTVRPISRPGEHQRLVNNGHKRVHALKFQSLALPNGLIGHLFGPVGEYQY